MNNGKLKIKYKHPVTFYVLSTVIPWTFWFIAGKLSREANPNTLLISILGFIGLLAPMIVAFWLIHKETGLKKDLGSRTFNFKNIKPVYLFLTAFLMLASILLAQAISLLFGYSADQFTITGHYTFSSGVFPVWFLLIMAPVIEELGWHTYGTDVLRAKFNLFYTSIIFALYWGIWHIPLSTIKNYYQSNLVETGWIYGVNFLVSIFPFVIIMNWLYYKANRNIIVPIIFHITAGYFNEIFATHPMSKVIQTGILLLFAIIIVMKEKKFFFNK
jgi:membrane protease YdiL (CAAX protease family)